MAFHRLYGRHFADGILELNTAFLRQLKLKYNNVWLFGILAIFIAAILNMAIWPISQRNTHTLKEHESFNR